MGRGRYDAAGMGSRFNGGARPALVLGLGETGLAVARALGAAGIRVFGFDSRRRMGFRSRHVSAARCPHPVREAEPFVEVLLAFARRHAPVAPVVFVTSDAFVHAVGHAWDRLLPALALTGPPPSVTSRLLEKHTLHAWCLAHGVPVPTSVHVPAGAPVPESLRALTGPVFIKPDSPVRRGEWGGAKGTEAADGVAAAIEITRTAGHHRGVMVQEVVQGPDDHAWKYCACMDAAGRPVLEFSLRKIRNLPIRFGTGSACVSRHDPEVIALGRRVFTALGYRGVGSIEFKRDARDGALKLIEINARYWQQASLPVACGMDFATTQYRLATGCRVEPQTSFTEGVRWVSLDRDARAYASYRREGALTRRDWIDSLRGPRVYADLSWRDPWPVLGSPARWGNLARAVTLAVEERLRSR